MKSVRNRSFSDLYLVLKGKNTDRKNSEYGHFSCIAGYSLFFKSQSLEFGCFYGDYK